MPQNTASLQDTIAQVDQELRTLLDVLTSQDSGQPLEASKVDEIKKLAAQAHQVLQQAAAKLQA